jgi:hypothetical protein
VRRLTALGGVSVASDFDLFNAHDDSRTLEGDRRA